MNKAITMRLIPLLVSAAFSGTAAASGFQLLEQNGSGLGNAYAGSAAVAENASTVFYNPAGMTELKKFEVSGGLTMVDASYKFTNNGSSSGVLSGNSDGGTIGYIPNGYLSMAVTKDIYLGLGIGAPFGLRSEYDNPWFGAAQSVLFDIKTANVNPSIAWRATDWVSLGFGVNWQAIEAKYERAAGAPTAGLAGSTATLKLNDNAWGWNVGALFKIGPATKIGISYRSTVKYDLEGNVAVTSNGSAAANGTTAFLNANGYSSSTKASVKLPDTFIFSVSHKLNEQWELLGDVSWTGWSSIPKIDIIRTSGVQSGAVAQTLDTEFRDTWRVATGANYRLNSEWLLKGGIAYDQSPVKGETTRLASLPDNNRTWLSMGVQWKPSKSMTVDVGAAYLFVKDSNINNDQRAANRGLLKGSYEDRAFLLGTQLSMAF